MTVDGLSTVQPYEWSNPNPPQTLLSRVGTLNGTPPTFNPRLGSATLGSANSGSIKGVHVLRIAIASDHAGFELKELLRSHLSEAKHEVSDLGTNGVESVDYPDFGFAVGNAVSSGEAERGIAICGSGVGISIAANKVEGVRAVNAWDVTSARLSRLHNDANVLCFGQRLVGQQTALEALEVFLKTEFEAGRHTRRKDKLG